MQKHTGGSYGDIADKYADAQDNKPWNLYFERPGVLGILPNVKGLDVLDAGCGPGFYARHFADQGARVTALDLNPVFVERTRLRSGGRVTVHQADLAEPLSVCRAATFDLVTCILVLHYLNDWLPILTEFHRVLRPGGLLVFSTHHPFSDLEASSTGDYFATDLIEEEWDVGRVSFYRRPLSKMTRDLLLAGFLIQEIAEPRPIKPPDGVEFKSYERIMKKPQRLLVRAVRSA